MSEMHSKEKKSQRTLKQNKCMHKYFELLAQELNGAGLDMRKTLKPSVEIPWTKESVKEHLWKPIQEAMINRESTTKLNTAEVGDIYSVLNRHMGEKHGIYVGWPHYE